jgi:hypothetical protein
MWSPLEGWHLDPDPKVMMMPRIMYDSVTATDIPRSARMVAGYLAPSRYAWSAQDWARFPSAVKVRIAIFANVNAGHVLDVEPGDATPAQAPGWVAMRRRAGLDEPSVYCSASSWPSVRAEFQRQGVRQPRYWIARFDNVRDIPAGAVAKQFINPPGSGGHYDLSLVADNWPGVDQEDDLSAQELLDWPIRRQGSSLGGATSLRAVLANVDRMFEQSTAREAAILRAIEELSADPELDRATVAGILDTAVAEHTPTAAQVAAAQLPLVEEAVHEALGSDQADLAADIVRRLAEKLAPADPAS